MACVIVLGCYRSGTSAVAGVCHKLGVSMGKSFDKPSRANPKGYFEDLEFKNFHKDMDQGLCCAHPYTELVESREKEYCLWGVKDPRLCLFLPELTTRLTTNHCLINCIRPLEMIKESLHRQVEENPWTRAFYRSGCENWNKVAQKCVESKALFLESYEGPILNVQFSDLLSDPKKTVERIANFVSGDRPFTSWSSLENLSTAVDWIG